MSEFNRTIREWCPESEFSEIYSINHPTANKNEVHFIKNRIRVCCVKDFNDEYFYLNAECFLRKEREILTLKSGKEFIYNPENNTFNTEKRDSLLSLFDKKIKVIENRNPFRNFVHSLFKYRYGRLLK